MFSYCKRVCRVIRGLRSKYLYWPSPEERKTIADATQARSGFPKCVGSGDGSQITLEDLPIVEVQVQKEGHLKRKLFYCGIY